MFCLAGPNGCGKSTLLHCLTGHFRCETGEVLIDGRPVRLYSPGKLAGRLAYVPQNHVRSFPYQVLDVVAMGQIRSPASLLSKREKEDLALSALTEVGIPHLAGEEYTTLSGGELQLVLLARALCQDSDILILDEPAAHLDVKHTHRILNLLLRFSREKGKSVIFSTHDFNHPLQFEDMGGNIKMALMDHGRLSAVSAPGALLSSDSLGQMYQVRSRIVEIEGKPKRHFVATWSE